MQCGSDFGINKKKLMDCFVQTEFLLEWDIH